MTKLPLEVGNSCTFTKTISESDVYLFGGITGDYSQMHFNEAFMKTTKYGTRIVTWCFDFRFWVALLRPLSSKNMNHLFQVLLMDMIIFVLRRLFISVTP